MPRYHFHSADGFRDLDREGIELPDEASARWEAIKYAGEVLRGGADKLWSKGQWRVEVTDSDGSMLFTLITLAIDAPRAKDLTEAGDGPDATTIPSMPGRTSHTM